MTSGDAHGSDRLYDAKLALKRDGTMLSMRLKVIDDYGAYFQYGVGQHGNAMAQVTGPYKINSVEVDLTAVLTNKCQQGAYRGFGSEVGNFVIERLVDAACEELGMDPVEMRRLNLIEKDQFPYIMPTGNMYDSGNYQAVLDEALGMIDYDGWRKKQAEARKEGRYIGIGISTCQERSVFSATEFWMWNPNETPGFTLSSSPESVAINIDPTGKAFITLNAPFWGNSPETMAVQVLAEKLEIDPADISVGYADSDKGFNSSGPGGSRFTVMIAGAVSGAADVIKEKMLRVASHMLEADPSDLEFRAGSIGVQGVPGKEKTLAEVALHAHYFRLDLPEDHDLTSGIDAAYVYDHPVTTMPSEDRSDLGIFYPIVGHMCHIPVVEVDIETGKVDFLDYVAVHDCGTMVNPMTLAGHVRGGTVNGIGSALYEHFHYDENGQLQNVLLSDYLHPTLMEDPGRHPRGPCGDAVPLHRIRHQGRRRGRAHGRPAGDRGGGGGRAQALGHQGGFAPAHAQGAASAMIDAKRSRTGAEHAVRFRSSRSPFLANSAVAPSGSLLDQLRASQTPWRRWLTVTHRPGGRETGCPA